MSTGMTTAVLIADIHANAPALEAVLREHDSDPAAAIWCAGDIVGYNSYARETMAIVRAARLTSVHGNHDLMVAGRLPTTGLGPRARRGIEFARDNLTPEERDWLAALPSVLRITDDTICLHSMLGDTQGRLERPEHFRLQAEVLRRYDPGIRVCVTGHTHVPGVVRVTPSGSVETHRGARVSLAAEGFWFVNPGSVGEPRDGDMRASFARLDTAAHVLRFHRARYSRSRVVRMNTLRLPPLAVAATSNPILRWLRASAALLAPRLS
jgi:predicted phosphodiesterase